MSEFLWVLGAELQFNLMIMPLRRLLPGPQECRFDTLAFLGYVAVGSKMRNIVNIS
jgi:hypothetical protein